MSDVSAVVRLARTSMFTLALATLTIAGCKPGDEAPSNVEPPPADETVVDRPAEPGDPIDDDADGFDAKGDADVSNPDVVEVLAHISAARMFWLPYAVYQEADVDGPCPVVALGDNEVTVTGGCTTLDGTVFTGDLHAVGSDTGSLIQSLELRSFGVSRDLPCDGGDFVTERRSWDGLFDYDDALGDFTLVVSGVATATDLDACTGRPYDFHIDYAGTATDGETESRFEGAGRYSDSRFGRAEVETIDEVLGACEHEPESGTTVFRGAGREAAILYDGATSCDVDATVAWTLDGEVRGSIQGVSCSSAGGPTGALPALLGLVLFLFAGRRRGLAGLTMVGLAASLTGCKDKVQENTFETAEESSGLTVSLDRKTYRTGDEPVARLSTGSLGEPATEAPIVLSCEASEDAEILAFGSDLAASGVTIEVAEGKGTPDDGVLTVPPGAAFFALYAVDRDDPVLRDVPEDIVYDVAVAAGALAEVPSEVEPGIALTPDELAPPPGGKVLGTIFEEGTVPVQVPTRELIAITQDLAELDRLLLRTGGAVIDGPYTDEGFVEALISVEPSRFDAEGLPGLRALFGEQGGLTASHDEGLQIYTAALALQAEGFKVALNPKLQSHGVPTTRELEDDALLASMEMRDVPGGIDDCVPDDPTRPCAGNVPALWAHMALVGADQRRIPVAFLDNGFAPNDDFRRPRAGDFVQCDLSSSPNRCGPGSAEGPPTVGASLFGDRVWHGNGVVTVAGGVVNNGLAAGVGGQVVEPMLYNYGLASYAFEIGTGIRMAVDDGASCINISAGYPCRILLTVGPDFDVCSSEGRLGICATLTAAAHAAAATACAVLGPIPFVGPALCAAATSAAVAATGACLSTLALGDLQYSMARGVRYAEERGVPVIASAGNVMNPDALPGILRGLVDLEDSTLDNWRVIPASLPSVIAVGAVHSGDYTNAHFHGDRVDVWAPISSAYYAPNSIDDPGAPQEWASLGGTSAAAPYITGVVAAMQAVDPTLDPQNRSLTDAQRGEIVGRIRGHLRSGVATFSDAELVAMGAPSDPRRPRVIDPLGAVRAVTPLQTVIEDRGYDQALCFDETGAGFDDRSEDARTLMDGDVLHGTLVDIFPGGGLGVDRPDEDWFDLVLPGGGTRAGLATIEVRSVGRGRPFIRGADIPLRSYAGGVEKVGVYEALVSPGAAVLPFALEGGPGAYQVSASVEEAEPMVAIVEPFDGSVRCTGAPIRFEAAANYLGFASAGVPDTHIDWTLDGSADAGAVVTRTFFDEGDVDVSVRLFDDAAIEDSITLVVQDCIGSPPEVTITSPADVPGPGPDLSLWVTDFDAIGSYVEVSLQASVFDPDETIPEGSIVWTTSEAAVQGGTDLLGTGRNVTARLYTNCGGGTSSDHEVIVTVTDGAGNVTTARRLIRVSILC